MTIRIKVEDDPSPPCSPWPDYSVSSGRSFPDTKEPTKSKSTSPQDTAQFYHQDGPAANTRFQKRLLAGPAFNTRSKRKMKMDFGVAIAKRRNKTRAEESPLESKFDSFDAWIDGLADYVAASNHEEEACKVLLRTSKFPKHASRHFPSFNLKREVDIN